MAIGKSRLIYTTAFALRLALSSVPFIENTLVQRVELSTPVTSFKRRKTIGLSRDTRLITNWNVFFQ